MNTVASLLNLALLCPTWVCGDVTSPPIKKRMFRSVRFVDSSHGWVAGYRGVFFTKDGGLSWQRLSASVGSSKQQAPRATSEDAGFIALADRARAIVRTDKGLAVVSWNSPQREIVFSKDALEQLYAIRLTDSQTGAGLGYSNRFFQTTDGGATWQLNDNRMPEGAIGLHAVSASDVWAVGNRCTVMHTTDGGKSWTRHRLIENNSSDLYSIYFIGPQDGWVCGSSGLLFRTTDGGKSWQKRASPVSNGVSLMALSFSVAREGWAVGSRYIGGGKSEAIVLHTDDGGLSWERQTTEVEDCLVDVQALTNGAAWAVGWDGTVLRTVDNGKHWTQVKLN